MVLAELGHQIASAIQEMSKKAVVGDKEISLLLNDIARALLQADVSLAIVKKLQNAVKAEIAIAEGAAGLNLRKIAQQAVFNAVKRMMDPGVKPFVPRKGVANVVMFVGLQGSGKTTSVTKYALYFQKKGFKTAVVCADTFRAGAYDQLQQNASKAKVRFYGSMVESDPVVIAKEGVAELKREKYDLIVVDTSGRHKQEAALFEEMSQVESAIKPHDIVYVMDGTNGQAIYDQAVEFKAKVAVGSVIITKLDCNGTKGGGALSAVAATSSPIIFIGTGEHFDEFELFNPQSFTSKMLGFGDVGGLMETLKDAKIDANSELYKRFQEGVFTMRDMYEHLQNVMKLGPVGKILDMIPGMQGLAQAAAQQGHDGNDVMRGFLHILDSMTPAELDDPKIRKNMNISRMVRIAKGSGKTVIEVQNMMMTYCKFEEVAKKMGNVNFKQMARDPQAFVGRSGSANMAQIAKALDPGTLSKLGGVDGLKGLMRQMQGMPGLSGMPGLKGLF